MEKNKVVDTEHMERVLSPEALDVYIRVAKPGTWLLTLALLILTTAVIVWGFIGSMPVTLRVNGVFKEKAVVCYVDISVWDDAIRNCDARIIAANGNVLNGSVTNVSINPLSRPEISSELSNDWLAEMVGVSSYAYQVTITLEDSDNVDYISNTLADVTLITAEVKPINLLLN